MRLTTSSPKRYRFFHRWRTLRDLHRYYDMVLLFHYRGKMTDRELSLHAEWVCDQKEALRDRPL